MKYAVTLRVERNTDVIVESDIDISKVESVEDRKRLIRRIERAAIRFYENNVGNRALVEEEPGVLGVEADFQGTATEEDRNEIKLTIKQEEWS